jgi:3-oxoacyl-(acyl-carrier-protein) synthase
MCPLPLVGGFFFCETLKIAGKAELRIYGRMGCVGSDSDKAKVPYPYQ